MTVTTETSSLTGRTADAVAGLLAAEDLDGLVDSFASAVKTISSFERMTVRLTQREKPWLFEGGGSPAPETPDLSLTLNVRETRPSTVEISGLAPPPAIRTAVGFLAQALAANVRRLIAAGALRDARTALAQRRTQLGDRQGWLDNAQELAGTASFRWNPTTGQDVWSNCVYPMLEYDRDVPPTFENFFVCIHPDDRDHWMRVAAASVQAGEPFKVEYRLKLPTRGIRHMQSVGRPDGDAYTGALIDLTEERQAEESLRARQSELARVSRVTTMGELAVSIAHEINQPLTSIQANAGASIRWLNREPPELEQVRAGLECIVRDSRRAGGVIRGLHALAAQTKPSMEPVEIDAVIREVLSVVGSDAEARRLELRVDLQASGARIFGERVQLQQVVLNLITNAIEAMETSSLARGVDISSRVEDGSVIVAVADVGEGLPDTFDQLFEPFFTTKANGMGMGLSICRSVVEHHGGVLTAARRAPAGSVFSFSLPIDPSLS
jgi:signal transduction histidine kinase